MSLSALSSALLTTSCPVSDIPERIKLVLLGILTIGITAICKKINEMVVIARNAHKPTVMIDKSFAEGIMLSTHCLLQVELRSGEKIAIDLAGAKFGWQEPVSHWKSWESQRAYGKVVQQPYGNTLMIMNQAKMMVGMGRGLNPQVEAFREKQAKAMLTAITDTIKAQQPGTGGSVVKVLKLSEYASFRSELMTVARHALETGYAELQASKKLRLYWEFTGQGGRHQVTDTTEQSEQVLEKVWLSPDEYRKHANNTPMLQTIWARRCEDEEVAKASQRLGMRLRFTSTEGLNAGSMPGNASASALNLMSQLQRVDVINPDGSSYQLPTMHSRGGNYRPPPSA